MDFLKGLAVGLLNFLLFLSLSAFGLVFMLNQTILDPDFVTAEVDTLELAPLVQELVEEELREEVSEEAEFLLEGLGDAIVDLEPWIKEEARDKTYVVYDYLTGESEQLSLVVSLEPMKDTLKDNFRQVFLESPPRELAHVPPAELEQHFSRYYQEFSGSIPDTFEFDESSIPAEARGPIRQLRRGIGYAGVANAALIGLIVLLILGIFLIRRQVKGTSRDLGITFLFYGIIEYAGIFAAKHFAGPEFLPVSLPSALETWLPQLFEDLLAPLEIFAIGVAVAGVVLLVVSFVYRRGPLA